MSRISSAALLGLLAVGGGAHAASCGTFAAPTACSVTSAGLVTYTVTGLTLVTSSGTPGYQAGDININIAVESGTSMVMSFNKNASGPTPGIVFAANAGQQSNFTLRYDVQISPALPGSVTFASSLVDLDFLTSSATGNGFSSIQLVLTSPSDSASCNIVRNVNTATTADCALPAGLGATMTAGNLVNLSGLTGNTSIGTWENHFSANFSSAVPEPGSWALFGVGALVIGRQLQRRRRTAA